MSDGSKFPQGRHGLHRHHLQRSPIVCERPNHVELKVEYCEPGARGDTATSVSKPSNWKQAPRSSPHVHPDGQRAQDRHRSGEYANE